MVSLSLFRSGIAYARLLVLAPVIALLGACSGSQLSGSAGSQLPNSTLPKTSMRISVTPASISSKDLFIGANYYTFFSGSEVLIVRNGTFKGVGAITQNVTGPVGSWVDSHGLYIANHYTYHLHDYGNVVEYSSAKANGFTYSAKMSIPEAVTTDYLGNVYEADGGGWVNEYAQRKNVVKATCATVGYGSVYGVAVDGGGHVFVAYDTYGSYKPVIIEITDFVHSCFSTLLGATLKSVGDMVLDEHNDVVVCDPYNGTVDIIKPPYYSVSGHLGSGFKDPVTVALNAANNRAYVVDGEANTVYVLYYPSGKVVGKLVGGSNTLLTAVDGSNYVP